MDEFTKVKNICKNTLEAFVNDEEFQPSLDELEIDILSTALAQALTGKKQ